MRLQNENGIFHVSQTKKKKKSEKQPRTVYFSPNFIAYVRDVAVRPISQCHRSFFLFSFHFLHRTRTTARSFFFQFFSISPFFFLSIFLSSFDRRSVKLKIPLPVFEIVRLVSYGYLAKISIAFRSLSSSTIYSRTIGIQKNIREPTARP